MTLSVASAQHHLTHISRALAAVFIRYLGVAGTLCRGNLRDQGGRPETSQSARVNEAVTPERRVPSPPKELILDGLVDRQGMNPVPSHVDAALRYIDAGAVAPDDGDPPGLGGAPIRRC